ncbi:hypothetical protein HGRIS_000541 [Hohenbuehelia grisea]|uniref:Uncharacterized protein n=1 Tax=Hohenbuehelia grisea TaxID=104357 RepID=A0ABR3JRC0_9AGAR
MLAWWGVEAHASSEVDPSWVAAVDDLLWVLDSLRTQGTDDAAQGSSTIASRPPLSAQTNAVHVGTQAVKRKHNAAGADSSRKKKGRK